MSDTKHAAPPMADLGQFVDYVWNLKQERDQLRAQLDDPDYPPKHSRRLIAQLRAEVEALRPDAERYNLLASMIVAECAGVGMTSQQAALFGSLNAITHLRTTAEIHAVFDAALSAQGGEHAS